MSFLDVFAEMLGGRPAEPAPSVSDLDVQGPDADVVPIAGDSHGPEEEVDTPIAPSSPPSASPTDPDVAQIDDLIRDVTYHPAAPEPDPTTVPDADPIGGLPGPDVIPVDVELPSVPLEIDTDEAPPDVVPIAGDSSGPEDAPSSDPAPPASSGVSEGLSAEIADSASGFVGDAVPFVGFLFGVVRANPWLSAALATIVVGLAIALPIGLSGGPSSAPPAASVPQTTPAATTAAPATTAQAAPTASAADVVIADFVLLMPQGFQFSLQAPAGAPSHETVVLGFTGPGLAPRATVSLAAGKSVPLKYPTSGCGHWTVRVVSIDGKAVDSKGNPNLENGMSHPCG